MPVVLVIGSYESVLERRSQILDELLDSFPGNVSLREERYSDLMGLYWYLPSEYTSLDSRNLRDRIVRLRMLLDACRIDALYLDHLLDSGLSSLFVFDMDSTMIREEVIDELARMNGLYEQVAQVTKEAMEGGLGFEDALRRRVNHLAGLPENCFDSLYPLLNPNPGVIELLSGLKSEFASKRVVLSGGFSPILKQFQKENNLDYVEANELVVESGKLTGGITGRIVGKERKREALIELRNQWNIARSQVVAVGDGANDLLMIQESGLGIGFHAKDGLKREILNWIDYSPMTALFLLFRPSL